MSGPTFFLHIGPPKTATTFLQEEILQRVQSAVCRIKPDVKVGNEEIRFADLFLRSPEIWRGIGENVLSNLAGKEFDKNLIVSDEGVYGGVASPQPWIPSWIPSWGQSHRVAIHRQTSGQPAPSTFALHLDELKSVATACGFSKTKVLMTLRRQDTKLASSYAQLSNRVRGASQSHFEEWVRHLVQSPLGYYMEGGVKLDYLYWWKKITKVLCKENVLFLPFEILETHPEEFLEQWLGFLEVSEQEKIITTSTIRDRRNEGSIGKAVWSIRNPMSLGPSLGVNRLLRKMGARSNYSLQWVDFSRDHQIRLTSELKEGVLEVYREGNRVLDQSVCDLHLSDYEYY